MPTHQMVTGVFFFSIRWTILDVLVSEKSEQKSDGVVFGVAGLWMVDGCALVFFFRWRFVCRRAIVHILSATRFGVFGARARFGSWRVNNYSRDGGASRPQMNAR